MKYPYVLAAVLATSQAMAATEVRDCVIQEVIPGKQMTGAFLTLVHQGEAVEISNVDIASITDKVELHQMVMKGDVMEMSPLTDKTLTEGERMFKKGGDHLMLMDIPADKIPQVGDMHTITVHFSDGSSASCEAEVKSVAAIMEAAQADGAHEHEEGEHQH